LVLFLATDRLRGLLGFLPLFLVAGRLRAAPPETGIAIVFNQYILSIFFL